MIINNNDDANNKVLGNKIQTLNNELIAENIEKVKKRVFSAAERSGRNPCDIKIIAVTKTVSAEAVEEAIKSGITDMGENRVQELCSKYEIINNKCSWHLIGHLQKNKVKYVIDKVRLIHSVDSVELAEEINKHAAKANKIMDVLVQVNVSGEETKFGIEPGQVYNFLTKLSGLGNIKVRGLMTIAPLVSEKEDVRPIFRQLKKIFIDMKNENIDNISMEFLSMGMSNDFEVAIEEGSNMVRIGTAIFGKRN